MINYVYQLVSPQVFSIKYEDIDFSDKVIIRPRYMAICHADQRYYLGQRDRKVLAKKLPMALIHECFGEVVYDPGQTFDPGEPVVLIPNHVDHKDPVIYENYAKGSYFLSSGHDGFLREYVDLAADRVVSAKGIPGHIGAVSEFVSVAVHAATRFGKISHEYRDTIGIWGDGSLACVVSCVLKKMFPKSRLVIIGKNPSKLSFFSHADETWLSEDIPEDLRVDHAFECCGGEGSYYAIDDIIHYINPQGTVMLMGVSENKVAINTRDVLEKGLTLVGSSRSGRPDFEKAVEFMKDPRFTRRLGLIIYEDKPVTSIKDIHRVFRTDLDTPFKTAFRWEL